MIRLSYSSIDWNSVLSRLGERVGKDNNFSIPQLDYATLSNGGERVAYHGKAGSVILDWDQKKKEWEAFEKEAGELSWSPKKLDCEDEKVLSSYARGLQEYLR